MVKKITLGSGKAWRRIRVLLIAVVGVGALTASFSSGVYVHKNRARLRAMLNSVQSSGMINTSLYNIKMEMIEIDGKGRDGGIAAVENGILLANRLGVFFFVDSVKTVRPLGLRAPINIAEFESDPYNVNTVRREQFGVKDILVQRVGNGLRIFASHNQWFRDKRCYTLRVSSIELTYEELMYASTAMADRWKTVFDTWPCVPLSESPDGKVRNPSLGAGGRLGVLSEQQILVTVGGMGPENEIASDPREESGSYGATVLIDLATSKARIYSVGHRNPQGLAISPTGEIWSTEHAARGGDELNRIVDGNHYGHPHVTYGTEYEMMVWPANPAQGRHEGYAKPTYVWTPSIGVSQLIVLEGNRFPHWKGDLIVSSLTGRSLFRVRVEEGRTIFAEPIEVGHRIRDIVEAKDGSIVLKSDGNFLIYVTPVDASDATLTPAERGGLLATQCQACHSILPNAPSGIGPNLFGVVGREMASLRKYEYSPALRAKGGRWTEDALRAYIVNPNAFVPGTSMQVVSTYDQNQINDLIAYLKTLD